MLECPLLGPEAKLDAQRRREEKSRTSPLRPQISPFPNPPQGYLPASAQPPRYVAMFRALQTQKTVAATLVEGAAAPDIQKAHEPSPSENEAGDT